MNASLRVALATPAVLLFAACAATRPPPHAERGPFGIVQASDPQTAQVHAQVLHDIGPIVARALPGLDVEPVDLRVVGSISDIYRGSKQCAFAGATFERGDAKWIEIRADLEAGPRRGVLAHELVHRWLGPAWDTLPPAMEDGLADVIGEAVRGHETPSERMRSFVACWITLNGELTLDSRAAPVDSPDVPFAITFRGDAERLKPAVILDVMGRDLAGYHSIESPGHFSVVADLARRLMSRLSVDELFDACRAAADEGLNRVPIERIFAAAHFDPLDLEQWNELLLESYGLEEQEAFREEVDMPWEDCKPSAVEGVSIRRNAVVEF